MTDIRKNSQYKKMLR